jgi:hypothetical protein
MCATCARYQYGFNFCTCPVFNATPKPATVAPPTWKGENLATGLLAYVYDPVAGELREIPADDFYLPPPEPSPLDRALNDFIERRKAKRRVEFVTDAEVRAEKLSRWADEDRARTLHRAATLPLDFPFRQRLAPYRGKE